MGYSILGFVHCKLLRGDNTVEEMNSNHFTGDIDFYIRKFGSQFYQFSNKSRRHLERAAEIWEYTKEKHKHVMYRVARAGDVYRVLFLITNYEGNPNENFLDNALDLATKAYENMGGLSTRDRRQVEKVYDNVVDTWSLWEGRESPHG